MRLSVENGTVVCSLENKNSKFLHDCAGLFRGFLNGKLKMHWDNPEEWHEPNAAIKYNAKRLDNILTYAIEQHIDIDESVYAFNTRLQADAEAIRVQEQAEKELQKQREYWERLCKNGCAGYGRCKNLAYDIDVPICKQTGEILKEKNVEKYIGGVLHLFNLEPFPSENCPFNINKKQGENNVQESTEKTSEAEDRYISSVGSR